MKALAALALTAATLLLAACGSDDPPTCSLAGGAPLVASAWPKFRADLANSGRSAVDLSSFAGSWQDAWATDSGGVTTGGAVSSSPAIGPEGEVYVGSTDGKLYRISAAGEIQWQGLTANAIVTGPAIDAGGRVFVTSNDGNLYAFQASTGFLARSIVAVIGIPTSPTVAEAEDAGVVYVGSLTTGLLAVCPNNILRWAAQNVPVGAMPAVDADGTLYSVGTNDARTVQALNPFNGVTSWVFTTTAAINASPALGDDGTVYVVDGRGRTFAIDPDDGSSPGVFFDAGAGVSASPALGADGTLYVADLGGKVSAIDPAGTVRWQVAVADGALAAAGAGQPINSSPAISADGTLIFGADDGWVYGLRDLGDSAELRWVFETGGAVRSSPAIADDGLGTVYVGSADRRVYALRPS